MFDYDDVEILSEKIEDQIKAAAWGRETYARMKRSDEATKRLKEKYTDLFLENIRKARARA